MVGSVSQASGGLLILWLPPKQALLSPSMWSYVKGLTPSTSLKQRCSGARVGPVTRDPSLPEDKPAEEFWGPGRSCGGNSYLGKASMPVSAARTEYSLFQG